MKLYIKQKIFSWRDRFMVRDEIGNDRYYVQGEVFSWGKKLHVYDASGMEAAFIREKVMSFMPRYFVEIAGRTVCQIVKEFTFFKPRYRVEGLDWSVEGNMWEHEYALTDRGGTVMSMSKHWFTWGDSYELDIRDARDELPCLCIALVIDCVMAAGDNN